MVIDDEEVVRETLADMLSDLSHRVVMVENGRDAVAKISEGSFDIVFTDLAMPEMDGWETARAIRQLKPELPLVLVPGHGATATPPAGETELLAGLIGEPVRFA